jgi:hypothetical protein
VKLYLYSPIGLHSIVLNEDSKTVQGGILMYCHVYEVLDW